MIDLYNITELLFTNSYITKEEYAVMLPPGSIPSPRAISILLSDYNCAFPTMEATITAACNIIDAYKQQAQTGRLVPIVEMTKTLDDCRSQQVHQLIDNSKIKFGKS